MRWLPWRRKQTHSDARDQSGAVAVAVAERVGASGGRPARGPAPSRAGVEPRGAALTFARDALALSGAQVWVEDADVISAALPDGTSVRYTGSLARARGEADATLLVPGGAALGTLLENVAERGGRASLALPARGDPLALATGVLAEPAQDCGRCVAGENANATLLCAACPLRAGRLALAGIGRVTGARELRRRNALAVELTYLVTYRDRDGRRDETHRLAYDVETGEPVAPVALEVLAASVSHAVPSSVDVTPLVERARSDLARTLDAGVALLALRATAEYQRRLHDLRLTHERLVRETPEARAELDAGHTAERARLADLFAVGVEAELVAIAYVTTALAEVAVRQAGADGGELTLTVDLGRGIVMSPACALCGDATRAGTLCAQGHLVCPTCRGALPECPRCAGEMIRRPAAPKPRHDARDDPAQSAGTLAIEQLADLSEPLWQSFVKWYLADEGYAAEPPEIGLGLPQWRLSLDASNCPDGADTGGFGCAIAMRPMRGRRLGAADVRMALEARGGESAALTMLVTTAAADAEALREAAAAGVDVVERDALAAFLARAAAAHATALAASERDAEACADAAHETQSTLLGALAAIEKEIAGCANTRRATGRGPLTAATNTVTAALHEAERALLAWDTLIDDWLASFDERAAPDGSLRIVRTPDELRALADRADHLRVALGRPLAALAATPGAGESGYTAWRKALVEQLTATCETLSWRASAVNLERWRDAQSARDATALAHAEAAVQRAKHTAARTAKARDLLAGRIGL